MTVRSKYLLIGVSALGLAMPGIAAAQEAASTAQDGAQSVLESSEPGSIVVTAIRRSLATAQAIK